MATSKLSRKKHLERLENRIVAYEKVRDKAATKIHKPGSQKKH